MEFTEVRQQGGRRIWPLRIYADPLATIVDAGKRVEGRVPDPSEARKQYGQIEAGDVVHFILRDNGESTPTDHAFTVAYVRHYETIRAMLEAEGLEQVLPQVDSVDDGVSLYHSFGGYEQRARQHGVYAIGLGERFDRL